MSEHTPHHVAVEKIDAWLPQTQCTQCGYPHCRAYAEAVAGGKADINQCPPGNEVTIHALATLLHIPPKPLDPRFGMHKPRTSAVIDENVCIGCRKCLDVCPVDAIIGARKRMHTVIAQECTGCELCLPPCPVDCIAMMPDLTGHARSASGSPPSPACGRRDGDVMDFRWTSMTSSGCAGSSRTPAGINEGEGTRSSESWPEYTQAEATRWRVRNEKRLRRLAQRKQVRRKPASTTARALLLPSDPEQIRTEIRAAVERVRARKSQRSGKGSRYT